MQTRTILSLCCILSIGTLSSSAQAQLGLQGPTWDTDRGPIEFNIEPSGSDDIDDGSDLEAIRAAFDAWGCVEGSAVRFAEGEPGIKSNDFQDGLNSIYFDEDGALGMGEATFSVSYFLAFAPGVDVARTEADIVFNGTDHEWKTDGSPRTEEDIRVDIQAVTMNEIGIVLGFSACDENQENCVTLNDSVMAPVIGPNTRELKDFDVAALTETYPTDDGSTCAGPFRQGQVCGDCNEDCVGDLICAKGDGDNSICTQECSAEDLSCPAGYGCLVNPDGTDTAKGYCVRGASKGELPDGATCGDDNECARGLCLPLAGLGRSVCQQSCSAASDCDEGYRCDNVCLYDGGTEGTLCEAEPEEEGCTCMSAPSRTNIGGFLALGLLGLAFLRRRNA